MFKKIIITSLLAFTLFSNSAFAELYRWVDDKGKVHYSDVQKTTNNAVAKTVNIKDKYDIPEIIQEIAIPYQHEEKNRTIEVSSIVLNMEAPEDIEEKVRIGRVTCGRATNIYWDDKVYNFKNEDMGKVIANVLSDAGYEAVSSITSTPSGGSLELRVKLTDVKMSLCPNFKNPKLTKNASYIEATWSLFDPALDKELVSLTTKGSHNAYRGLHVEDGTQISLDQAMKVSATNLLASQVFADAIKPGDLSELKEVFEESLSVEYDTGNGEDTLNNIVEYLKNNSVIVKTTNGHGSGVIINAEGYILTNAHVVGDEETFKVIMGKKEHSAKLIRKEKVRDVALIKMDDYSGRSKGVKLSSKQPSIGDELYIIGAPLKIELQHTMTKGIISATRKISGLPFYQTDAAINPGNSGGPVFDQHGELIALAVSGLFTSAGASLNINYLIPIDDAVNTLNLNESSSFGTTMAKLEGKTLMEGVVVLYKAIDNWFAEPLVRLY